MAGQFNGDISHPSNNGVDYELNDSHAPDGGRMGAAAKERGIAPRSTGTKGKLVCLSLGRDSGILIPMLDFEAPKKLVGPVANEWTDAQLEQFQWEIDILAALLLDIYKSRKRKRSAESCGLPPIDDQRSDR